MGGLGRSASFAGSKTHVVSHEGAVPIPRVSVPQHGRLIFAGAGEEVAIGRDVAARGRERAQIEEEKNALRRTCS